MHTRITCLGRNGSLLSGGLPGFLLAIALAVGNFGCAADSRSGSGSGGSQFSGEDAASDGATADGDAAPGREDAADGEASTGNGFGLSEAGSLCGDGILNPGEQCDDGMPPAAKLVDGGVNDGCNALCQIESGWVCPTPGKPCVNDNICGNGILTLAKQCDNGVNNGTDGCTPECTLEPGWICRVPGKPCTPICGNGVVQYGKECDTGVNSGTDGCSPTCQIEPGWSCTGSPSVCTKAVCGNGIVETGEACDCGTSTTSFPTGCSGPNGLFNGDGTGCSKTCTKEPICRGTSATNGTGSTHACSPTCGNGNIDTGEQCDDGNAVSGDGCSSTCMIESGYTCMATTHSDTQPCTQPINSGQCLELPVKLRDFKSEAATGGHPDFFYYGAPIAPANQVSVTGVLGATGPVLFSQRYCVPNSAGPARENDATARIWDLAQAALDDTGHPAFNMARAGSGKPTLADCQFTDWSIGGNNGHVPGYTMADSPLYGLSFVTGRGADGSAMYRGPAPAVSTAASFAQWWTDNTYTGNAHSVQTLELGTVGNDLYEFASAPDTVFGGFFPLDPAANNFPLYSLTGGITGGPGTVLTAANGEALHCDIWPYWYPGFGGKNCVADQFVFPPSFDPKVDPAVWFGENPNGGWVYSSQGWYHDSWFSVEARYLFTFNAAFQLRFFGDDDTFVFINGVLVMDLGGVHQRIPGIVSVDATGNATIQEGGNIYMACTNPPLPAPQVCPTIPAGSAVGDIVPCDGSAAAVDPLTGVAFNSLCASGNTTCDCRKRTLTATQLGLMPGNTYEIAIFERDGHPVESNFQLTVSGFSTNESVCQSPCGNGIVAGGKECDCGDGTVPVPTGCPGPNNNTTYDGCTTMCTWGPYCGDTIVQNPPEQCDFGSTMNTAGYGDKGGCTPTCKSAPYCGDGIVESSDGEQCDLGAANGMTGSDCSSTCQIVPMAQ